MIDRGDLQASTSSAGARCGLLSAPQAACLQQPHTVLWQDGQYLIWQSSCACAAWRPRSATARAASVRTSSFGARKGLRLFRAPDAPLHKCHRMCLSTIHHRYGLFGNPHHSQTGLQMFWAGSNTCMLMTVPFCNWRLVCQSGVIGSYLHASPSPGLGKMGALVALTDKGGSVLEGAVANKAQVGL